MSTFNTTTFLPSATTTPSFSSVQASNFINTAVVTLSANTTLNKSHHTVFVLGAVTIQLPQLSGNYFDYEIKNIGLSSVTVSAVSGNYIDGTSFQTLSSQYSHLRVVSDLSANWFIL